MHRFANPGRFQRLADKILPWSAAGAVIALAVGLYMGLFASPPDYQQGESVRIMYVHVPSAWMALFVYVVIALASASSLIWRHPLADLTAGHPLHHVPGWLIALLVVPLGSPRMSVTLAF